jgi:hypothetical protein
VGLNDVEKILDLTGTRTAAPCRPVLCTSLQKHPLASAIEELGNYSVETNRQSNV